MRMALGIAVMIACTAAANILLKLGAATPLSERPILGLLAWQSCAGVAAFGGALIIYAVLLQWLPLNVAQSFAALQFIAVIAASSYFLAEPISPARWLGIALIAAGVLTVGLGGAPPPPDTSTERHPVGSTLGRPDASSPARRGRWSEANRRG